MASDKSKFYELAKDFYFKSSYNDPSVMAKQIQLL